MIRVLIVDDSVLMRNLIQGVLSSQPDIEVVGTASDPYIARDKLIKLQPDVMTLDIEMPKMDGITFLEKVMTHFPVRTLILSSLSSRGSDIALKAIEMGAIDVMEKPKLGTESSLNELRNTLSDKIRTIAKARIKTTPQIELLKNRKTDFQTDHSTDLSKFVVAIASSTGGVGALQIFLGTLPPKIPPILIVQHMPLGFSESLAGRLHQKYPFEVKVAREGDPILSNQVLISPNDAHLTILKRNNKFFVHLTQDPPLHNVKPAADYLLKSVAQCVGSRSIGIILTGMGQDGAQGVLAIKNAGGFNIAQDEESSVVFGMAKSAIQLGAVHQVLPIQEIGSELMNYCIKRGEKQGD